MTGKDEFRPKLGRIRSRGGKASKRYLSRLYASVEKKRPGAFAKRLGGRFSGTQIGRGAGLGAAFISYGPGFGNFRARRVAVKIRSVRLGARGLAKARAHLRYIQRDGADKNGAPGKLYGPESDAVDSNAFLDEGKDDRHQFRIIISPEEASDLADLNSFTRDVMAAAEEDLGAKLDWVAVNHYDTDHPHVHVVLRGKTDQNRDLVIARDYITHGFRKRAQEIATLELGERRPIDIARSRFAETEKDRFTSLDRELLRCAKSGPLKITKPRTAYDRFRNKLLLARLRTLEKMQLADRGEKGWRLVDGFESTLRQAGRRGDIIRSMDQAFGSQLRLDAVRDFGSKNTTFEVIGKVVASGAADDAHDKRFVAMDGLDGKQWHVEIESPPGAFPPAGSIVEVSRPTGRPRKSDQTIDKIAQNNGGVYADRLHAAADPRSSVEYRLAHKRRLEALRRHGIVERRSDGSWRIPDDFLDRAARHESKRSAARIHILSWVDIDQLATAPAATILDDVLENKRQLNHQDTGFGAEFESALNKRKTWLIDEGLGEGQAESFRVDREKLRKREAAAMNKLTDKLAGKLGKSFTPTVEGERIEGAYRAPVETPSGRFAIIEKSHEFSLVPWRETLERRRGLEVSGVIGRQGVSWSFSPSKALGILVS